MHIVFVSPYYAPAYPFGGVVRSVEGMARALARRGHTVTVLTTDALSQRERLTASPDQMRDDVRVVRTRNLSVRLRGQFNLSTPLDFRRLAQPVMREADVIHCHEFRTVENLIVSPLAGDTPLVLSPHGTLTPSTGRSTFKAAWDRLLSPAVARRFDHVVGLTQAEVDEARGLWAQFGAQAGFSVVPNGVEPDEYPVIERSEREPTVLFMGRLHPRKGAHRLAQAFLLANIPGARLVIAGADEGGLHLIPRDPRIALTGYLSGAERILAFAQADVFALPAVGEGLPMGVLEAMATGLPAIISPGCHLPEVSQHGAGLIVEPEVEALAAALRDLLTDAGKRQMMGAAAARLVREHFTWDSIAVRLEAVYQSLI